MKLLKLSPEQLMQHWPYVKECILLAMPPFVTNTTENILRIQSMLLVSTLECWACIDNNSGQFYGILTTQISADEITLTRNLLIFSITLTEEHEDIIWNEGYTEMMKYAKARGCTNIIAYSNQQLVIDKAEKLGADVSWRFISFPVFNN
jgi:hypothetical protein